MIILLVFFIGLVINISFGESNYNFKEVIKIETLDVKYAEYGYGWVIEDFGFGDISIYRPRPFIKPVSAFNSSFLKLEESYLIEVCSKNPRVLIVNGFVDSEYFKSKFEIKNIQKNSCLSLNSKEILDGTKPINISLFYDKGLSGKYELFIDLKSEKYLKTHAYLVDSNKNKIWENNIKLIAVLVLYLILFFAFLWGVYLFIKKIYKRGNEIKQEIIKDHQKKVTQKIIEKVAIEEAVKADFKKKGTDEIQYLKDMILEAIQEGDYKTVERLTIIINKLENKE